MRAAGNMLAAVCQCWPTETAVAVWPRAALGVPEGEAMKDETKAWAAEVKAKGKLHGLGPPHLRAWAGLIGGLSSAEIGACNKETWRLSP